jgi:signal transduction histidine kinase
MQRLLEDLLELSRVGRVVNPAEDVALEPLVREAVELVKGQIDQAGAAVEIAPGLPVVRADRRRLLEVYQNLVENAAMFTRGRPSPRIEIGARRDAAECVLYVRDNGRGIEPRFLERVFDLFEKLDAGAEGTGVGLALVRRIVEAHGGRAWAEADGPGRGATFCFTLPQA